VRLFYLRWLHVQILFFSSNAAVLLAASQIDTGLIFLKQSAKK